MMGTSVKIFPGATVCENEVGRFRGDVTISTGCVIHPSASIIAKSGPIVLGENCLVEEYATIVHDLGDNAPKTDAQSPVLVIGSNNIFEVGCTIHANQIGYGNVFEIKSFVSNQVAVTNNCVIGAGCMLTDKETLPEKTVIYGNHSDRRETIEKTGTQKLQLDHLKKVLPNYHHLRKPTFDPKKNRSIVS